MCLASSNFTSMGNRKQAAFINYLIINPPSIYGSLKHRCTRRLLPCKHYQCTHLALSVFHAWLCVSSSFPTQDQRVFRSMWSSWPSCSCWVQQPNRLSPTTASTLPPGCTRPATTTSMQCASGALMERSWRMRIHITFGHCMMDVKWVIPIYIYLTGVAAILLVNTFIIWFFVVFIWCRHAQDKRGQYWKLMFLFPIPSLYLMLLCLILGRGTRSLVSKLAQSASMVNQTERDYSRSNLVGERAMDTFHLQGENTFRTYPVQKTSIYKLVYLQQLNIMNTVIHPVCDHIHAIHPQDWPQCYCSCYSTTNIYFLSFLF